MQKIPNAAWWGCVWDVSTPQHPLSSGAHGWAHPAPPRDPRCGHPTVGIHRGTGFGIPPGADTEVMMDLGWDAGTVPRSGDIPVPGTRTIVPGGSGSPRCLEAEGCEVGAETPRRGAGAPKQSPSVCAHRGPVSTMGLLFATVGTEVISRPRWRSGEGVPSLGKTQPRTT